MLTGGRSAFANLPVHYDDRMKPHLAMSLGLRRVLGFLGFR